MNRNYEVLLFLPSWNFPDAEQLSELLDASASGNASTVIVLVPISDDHAPASYADSRILRSITAKETVTELLTLCKVTQLPYSVKYLQSGELTSESSSAPSSSSDSYLISGSCTYSNCMIHETSSLASANSTATSSFLEGVECYNAFDFEAAAAKFFMAISMDPLYKSALFNFSGLLHMLGYPTLAVHYIERVLLLDKEDMIAHSFLWAVTQIAEVRSVGVDAYRRLAAAGDIKAAQKLAALTGEGDLAAKGATTANHKMSRELRDPKYAQRIYDDMGDQFEDKLVSRLGYRGPWDLFEMLCGVIDNEGVEDVVSSMSDHGEGAVKVDVSSKSMSGAHSSREHSSDTTNSHETKKDDALISAEPTHTHSPKAVTLSKYPKRGCWRILDLGCGSGLCGKVFRELVSHKDTSTEEHSTERDASKDIEESNVLGVDTDVETFIASEGGSAVEGQKDKEGEGEDDDDQLQLERLRTSCAGVSTRNRGGDRDQCTGCMIGVDVSMRMVEITRRSGCYDCVGRADLSSALSLFERINTPSSSSAGGDVDKLHGHNQDNSAAHAVTGNSSGAVLPSLDLIIAADTFIYVGALGRVFDQVRNALGVNGIFLFSIEDLDSSPMRVATLTQTAVEGASVIGLDTPANRGVEIRMDTATNSRIEGCQHVIKRGGEVVQVEEGEPVGAVPGWGGQLLKSARFAHSNSYIEILCEIHGFDILMQRSVVLRTEETIPLHGILYVLQARE